MTTEKSKILVIGGTGYIGKFIVEGSAKSGHQTFALVREASLSDPAKGKMVQNFKDLGVTILNGDLSDKESLVKAIQHVDVVISTVGLSQLMNQLNIISAIKESGKHIKRFLPSEFGNDVDRTLATGPAKSEFSMKAEVRRAVEAEGVPYTYVINNCFDGYFLATLAQCETRLTSPPRDKVTIYGDGNAKAILNKEEDIAAYTMRAVDDPRTLNKTVYINPPKNIVSQNDVVALWESKIGKTLEKTYVSEEELLKKIPQSPHPLDLLLALNHAIFVKGDQTWFTIEPSFGVEASQLYPDVKYTSVNEYLSQYCTIKTVDDPKTVNKILYIKPPENTLSMNEMVAFVSGSMNVIMSINHSVFVKGDQKNFTIEPSFGLEASVLYLDVMYTCIDEYLSHFA
ncbi:hypothetical protein HID58_005993 [Brassica napus]|uniref:NmrA-like domain-containing protein n=1 Tax=Brassica napus TaxID=3708 RepID=A0ABQ8EA60_BRANA|nr:hypothetical protein HID58_005993 [Brassica napus]